MMPTKERATGIRKMREAKGYPQPDFADLIQIPFLTLRAMEAGRGACPDPLFGRIVKTAAECEPYREPPQEFEAVLAISERGSLHLPEEVLKDLGVTRKNQHIMMYNWDTSIALARPPFLE